jgi:hypothetical protein
MEDEGTTDGRKEGTKEDLLPAPQEDGDFGVMHIRHAFQLKKEGTKERKGGEGRQGKARQGKARQGKARQGRKEGGGGE